MLWLFIGACFAEEYEINALLSFSETIHTSGDTKTTIRITSMLESRVFVFLSKNTYVDIQVGNHGHSERTDMFEISGLTDSHATIVFTKELTAKIYITPITACTHGAYAHGGGTISELNLPYLGHTLASSFCVFAPMFSYHSHTNVTWGYQSLIGGVDTASLHVGGPGIPCLIPGGCELDLEDQDYYISYTRTSNNINDKLIFKRKNDWDLTSVCQRSHVKLRLGSESSVTDVPWDFRSGDVSCHGDLIELLIVVAVVVAIVISLVAACCCCCGACLCCCCRRRSSKRVVIVPNGIEYSLNSDMLSRGGSQIITYSNGVGL